MKIILIRHGMTEGNLKRRYIGTTDEDLINTDCLKGDYPKCERVVASPLKRCIQTAEYIYPNVDIEICDKLKECDFGDFENKSYEDLKDNPDYQKWLDSNGELPFPNGDTHEEFKNRCKRTGIWRDSTFVITAQRTCGAAASTNECNPNLCSCSSSSGMVRGGRVFEETISLRTSATGLVWLQRIFVRTRSGCKALTA